MLVSAKARGLIDTLGPVISALLAQGFRASHLRGWKERHVLDLPEAAPHEAGGTGIDGFGDLLDVALAHGVVEKNGAHLSFGGRSIGNGREKAREALQADAGLCADLRAVTLERLDA